MKELSSSQVSTVIADPSSVDDAILSRFSTRAYMDKPVDKAILADLLQVAARAPSGTNTQPWKVYVVQGAAKDKLVAEVCDAHNAMAANPALAADYAEAYDYYPTQWVSPYIDRRRECGFGLYGVLGIGKGDKEKMHLQQQQNFRFFGALLKLAHACVSACRVEKHFDDRRRRGFQSHTDRMKTEQYFRAGGHSLLSFLPASQQRTWIHTKRWRLTKDQPSRQRVCQMPQRVRMHRPRALEKRCHHVSADVFQTLGLPLGRMVFVHGQGTNALHRVALRRRAMQMLWVETVAHHVPFHA